METAERLYTADEFLARDWELHRWEELIDGRIVLTTPKLRHQQAVGRIYAALLRWSEEGAGFGIASISLDLRIDDRNVLAPDVLWYADTTHPGLDVPAQLLPPQLVVEVRSPSTWKRDRGVKRERYEAWGVQELWLVDTQTGTVVVHRRGASDAPGFDTTLEVGHDELLRSPILPGFELPARSVFAV
ncbi:MAG: Uma2 family endonuclease [Actinomycetota bacterium]|nr:Uma2 family endonuclease [Actinomycetota bacterium]